MTHIEQLHLEAIESEVFIPYGSGEVNVAGISEAAKKSAEITKQIAIEFVLWIYYNEEWVSTKTNEELFKEYLKSKENETKN